MGVATGKSGFSQDVPRPSGSSDISFGLNESRVLTFDSTEKNANKFGVGSETVVARNLEILDDIVKDDEIDWIMTQQRGNHRAGSVRVYASQRVPAK